MIGTERIKSGVPGLDKYIEGGFPFPMVLVIEGDPGTYKSTLALQILFHNAKGKNRIYFSGITEPFENTRRHMARFSFFDMDLVMSKDVHFIDVGHAIGMADEKRLTPTRATDVQIGEPFETIVQRSQEFRPDLIVVDPLLTSYSKESLKYRQAFYEFLKLVRNMGIFAIVVIEEAEKTPQSAENYMVDGVLTLAIRPLVDVPNEYRNVMKVTKMRGTRHTKKLLQLDLDDEGMTAVPLEQYIIGSP